MKILLSLIIIGFTGLLFQQLYNNKLLMFQEESSFPYLEAGHYLGEIEVHDSSSNTNTPFYKTWFYLQSTVKPSLVFSFIGQNKLRKTVEKNVDWTMLNTEKLGSKLPIAFKNEYKNFFCVDSTSICKLDANFLLVASQDSNGEYQGFIKQEVKGKILEEKIANIKFKEINAKTINSISDLEHVALLLKESLSTNLELKESLNQLSEIKKEKVKFDNILFNKSDGFKKVKDQFEEEEAELKKLKLKLKSLNLEEQNLKAKSSLMQKIQPYGKLVALARESLDREAKLIEKLQEKKFTQVITKTIETGADLQDKIFSEKQKILELKRMKAEYENR